MAEAGVFYLTISGGEIFLRRDFFEILERAHARTFCIRLKTNGILIRDADAARLRDLGVESVQISIYSHRPEIHDAITEVPGSLRRSIEAVRLLRNHGIRVDIANVLMVHNARDYDGVKALAADLGTQFFLDPTITNRVQLQTALGAVIADAPFSVMYPTVPGAWLPKICV